LILLNRKRAASTLIELIVVMAIVAMPRAQSS
jgi:type II secretory pathway pseudopilin PulG